MKYKMWDGNEMTEESVKQSDAVLITGTAFVNRNFDSIMNGVHHYRKDDAICGVTGAGICEGPELDRLCPYSRT